MLRVRSRFQPYQVLSSAVAMLSRKPRRRACNGEPFWCAGRCGHGVAGFRPRSNSCRRTAPPGGVVDAIANKAAAFHEMQFLLSGLPPAVLDFRIVIVDGLFNLRRRFCFSRRRLSPCCGCAKQNNTGEYRRRNRDTSHQPGLHERRPFRQSIKSGTRHFQPWFETRAIAVRYCDVLTPAPTVDLTGGPLDVLRPLTRARSYEAMPGWRPSSPRCPKSSRAQVPPHCGP